MSGMISDHRRVTVVASLCLASIGSVVFSASEHHWIAWCLAVISALSLGPVARVFYFVYAHWQADQQAPSACASFQWFCPWDLASAATGLVAFYFLSAQPSVYLIALALFVVAVQLSLSDLAHRVVSDLHLLALFACSGLWVLAADHSAYYGLAGVIGMLLALVTFGLNAFIGRALGIGSIGVGDVYLGLALGLLLGPLVVPALLCAVVGHLIWQVSVLKLLKRSPYLTNPQALPLAPALCLAGYGFWLYSAVTQTKSRLIFVFM